MYNPDKQSLLRIRQAIRRDGRTLARRLRRKRFQELFGELHGERNKRLPKEFAEVVERFPFIANKQFYYYAEYKDPLLLLQDALADFVMQHYRAGKPVNEFLSSAVR